MFRVLHISSLISPLSQFTFGGAEAALMLLSEAQAKAGAQVSVIAVKGSRVPEDVNFVDLEIEPSQIVPIETSRDHGKAPYAQSEIDERLKIEYRVFKTVHEYLKEHRSDIDIIHNCSYDYYPFFDLQALNVPMIHTLHLPPLLPWINNCLKEISSPKLQQSFVSVSMQCALFYEAEIGWRPKVCYNGTIIEDIPFRDSPEEHFLWVGRISPEKGLHTAMELVIDKMQAKLVVIGSIYDKQYFNSSIEPYLQNPLLDFRGHLPHDLVLAEMGKARALLFPIEWEEPFGLVLIEALAAGTPVVAYQRGAVAEIIEHGANGFTVRNKNEMLDCLQNISQIDRLSCRSSVEKRFSMESMRLAYERAYRRVLEK